jgi:PKD repeat protein
MKQLSIFILLSAIIISSCQKSKESTSVVTPPVTSAAPAAPAPTASFKITSTLATGNHNVQELKTMVFENDSENGDSFFWDFGNGTTSTEKVPSNITLWPCQTTLTIKLTVTSKNGKVATYSDLYNVICYRTIPGATAPGKLPEGYTGH